MFLFHLILGKFRSGSHIKNQIHQQMQSRMSRIHISLYFLFLECSNAPFVSYIIIVQKLWIITNNNQKEKKIRKSFKIRSNAHSIGWGYFFFFVFFQLFTNVYRFIVLFSFSLLFYYYDIIFYFSFFFFEWCVISM